MRVLPSLHAVEVVKVDGPVEIAGREAAPWLTRIARVSVKARVRARLVRAPERVAPGGAFGTNHDRCVPSWVRRNSR